MKKLTLSILFATLLSLPVFCNPAPPVGIIVEVYFEGDDWFLVADNYCMEMYGIESFQEIEIWCSGGHFNFDPDFLPDFNSGLTIITRDALLNTVNINQIDDHISVYFDQGYTLADLEWGPSEQDGVSGPLPGQTLMISLFTYNQYFNYEWFTVKGNAPNCYYGGCSYKGIFEGHVRDENGNPVANAEIVYLPNYFYYGGYYFSHILTDPNGYFYYDYMPAKNFHIHKIIIDEVEYDVDEFIQVEPNETTSMDFEIVITGMDDNLAHKEATISNSPNPFSGQTTFLVKLPAKNGKEHPVLYITDMLGQIVDIVEIRSSQIKNNTATISWTKEPSLPSGNYIVVLKDGNTKLCTHKITIE